jgi:hypothetical protein
MLAGGYVRKLVRLEVWLVMGLAAALFSVPWDGTVFIDEMYHILAARSWLADGTLRMAEGGGPYLRGWGFTYLVAGSFALFGESLWSARLPSVLAATALIGVVFSWLRAWAGRPVAYTAIAMLALTPTALHQAQMARFYTLQALGVMIAAVGAYALVTRPGGGRRMVSLAGAIVLAGVVALHVQPSSVIPLGFIGLWAVAVGSARWLEAQPAAARRARAMLLGTSLGLAALIGLGLLWQTGLLETLWTQYQAARYWAKPREDDVLFYHDFMYKMYGLFWDLFPLVAVVALYRYRSVASLSLTIFVGAFVVHSFGAMKAERYIFYALPFFWALWAMALVPMLGAMNGAAQAVLRRWWGIGRVRPMVRLGAGAWIAVALCLTLYHTPAFYKTPHLLLPGLESKHDRYRNPDWADALPKLKPLLDEAEVILTSPGVSALYHLGHFDAELANRAAHGERDENWRTGRPVLYDAEAVRRWLERAPSGLVVVEQGRWGDRLYIMPEVVQAIEQHAKRVPLPEASQLKAYYWKKPQNATESPDSEDATTAAKTEVGN